MDGQPSPQSSASSQDMWHFTVLHSKGADTRPQRSCGAANHRASTFCSKSSKSESSSSAESIASWISVHSDRPRCFLPNTAFRRTTDGAFVRAAGLRKGDLLEGPDGSTACVMEVRKHKPGAASVEFIQLTTEGGSFVCTWNHQLLVVGPDGECIPIEAQTLMNNTQRMPSIVTGAEPLPILKVEKFSRCQALVELCFASESSAVLAWVFPSGRLPRSVRRSASVACLGRRHGESDSLDLAGLAVSKTFLDDKNIHAHPATSCRSSSVGAHVNPRSCWSIGTLAHDEAHPERCKVCPVHHRFLHNALDSSRGSCRRGALCRLCHAAHHERDRNLKLS